MNVNKGSIVVKFRSHITPSAYLEGFELGKQITIKLASSTTLQDLVNCLFYNNREHISFVAVNGVMVRENRILADGDLIDVFSYISGG